MMKIIDGGNKRRVARVMGHERSADHAFTRQVRAIVDGVRNGGDRALLKFARRFDRADPPLEISKEQMRDEAGQVAPEVRAAIARAARNIAKVAFRQIPKHWDVQ